MNTYAEELLRFIDQAPTAYHTAEHMAAMLREAGFTELLEGGVWALRAGQGYFLRRNGSSLIAFRIPKDGFEGFQIVAAHGDSPSYKLKKQPETAAGGYLRLNVEQYGGALRSTWFDRPLSIAGRVVAQTPGGVETRLVDLKRPVAVLPSLAIHMDRTPGAVQSVQKEMLPLLGGSGEEGELMAMIAQAADVDAERVLDHDLFVYPLEKGFLWGKDSCYLSAPRLDDLMCAWSALRAMCAADNRCRTTVLAVFDNEEVGSGTKQGAASMLLADTLQAICAAFGKDKRAYDRCLANSLLVSADNAHAIHPAHPDKADPVNHPRLNGGIVIKYSAAQKYTTDALSAALLRTVCKRAGVPVQSFQNHSDVAGGSTLGHIAIEKVSVNAVDIGIAQLAMHSCCETAGTEDLSYLVQALAAFYHSAVTETAPGCYSVQ